MAVRNDQEVQQILDDVRARVHARRATSGIAADDQALTELQAAVQDVNVHARVNSHLPLLWEDLVVGRLRALVQRGMRRLLRWYINPIVDQQNIFNAAAAKALTLLAAENARLQHANGELAERVAALEKELPSNDQ